MKKKIVFALSAIMVISMGACGQADINNNDTATTQKPIETTENDNGNDAVTETQEETQVAEEAPSPEELYKETLDAYVYAFSQGWADTFTYEENGFNYVYGLEEQYLSDGETMLSKMGYAFLDINDDGSPELFIDSIPSTESSSAKGDFLDMYTISDGKAILVAQGAERDIYYLGKDNAIYNYGSGGAAFTEYIKYSLDSAQNCLKIEEALYSQGDDNGDYWWEYTTDVTDTSSLSDGKKNDSLVISQDEADNKSTKWLDMETSITYIPFDTYASGDSASAAEENAEASENAETSENAQTTTYYHAAGKYGAGNMSAGEAKKYADGTAYIYETRIEENKVVFVGSFEVAGEDFNYELQAAGEWEFELNENAVFVNSDEREIEISREEGLNSLKDGWIDMVFTVENNKIVKVSFGC